MATASILGRGGSIRFSTSSSQTTAQTKIAELRTYTLTVEGDIIDVTNHDSTGWRETLQGTRSWTVDAEVNYLSTGAGQGIIRIEFTTTNPVLGYVSLLQTTATNAKLWKGRARITGFTVNHDQNDAVLGNLTFAGSGGLTRVA